MKLRDRKTPDKNFKLDFLCLYIYRFTIIAKIAKLTLALNMKTTAARTVKVHLMQMLIIKMETILFVCLLNHR